ncbi:MAG: hypothetical protein IJY11_03430 [Clostridia bacterium]|nr:hypothetical protein [Clostridia bacterium]
MSETKRSSLKEFSRQAKNRIKNGFWEACKEGYDKSMRSAKEQGVSESKAGQYFKSKVAGKIAGEKEDDFYVKVKEMLLAEGEVSDAIGRLTDKAYYDTLSYEEKQRYTLSLSERYLRALERFRKECEFDVLDG